MSAICLTAFFLYSVLIRLRFAFRLGRGGVFLLWICSRLDLSGAGGWAASPYQTQYGP